MVIQDTRVLDLTRLNRNNYLDEIKFMTQEILGNVKLKDEEVIITYTDKYRIIGNYGNYFTLLNLISPFFKYDKEIDFELVKNFDYGNTDSFAKYFDKIILYFRNTYEIEIGSDIITMIDNLNLISYYLLLYMGITMDLINIVYCMIDHPEFYDIVVNCKIQDLENKTFEEIIEITTHKIDTIEEIIYNIPECCLNPFIRSGSGLNKQQLGQCFGYIGCKPDFYSSVLSVPIDTNFIMGLQNVTEFFINCVGARKSLLTSKTQVKNSGWKLNVPSYSNICRITIRNAGSSLVYINTINIFGKSAA